MRLTAWRVAAFLLLVALSVGFGFGYDAIATGVERSRYPRPDMLSSSVRENADTYGLPEHIVWSLLKVNSNFQSNAVTEDGAIGLCRLTPSQFEFICTTLHGIEKPDDGMLYDPNTNLRAGCAYLSYLYDRYGVWDHAYAAYFAGTETVDAWLRDATLVSEQGVLTAVPDDDTEKFVSSMQKAVRYYEELYD